MSKTWSPKSKSKSLHVFFSEIHLFFHNKNIKLQFHVADLLGIPLPNEPTKDKVSVSALYYHPSQHQDVMLVNVSEEYSQE